MKLDTYINGYGFTSYLKEAQDMHDMMNVAYCPHWFYHKDIAIDLFSIITMLFVAYFAFRWYQVNTKNKKLMYLALGFFMISLSFIAKIFTNFRIYNTITKTSQVGLLSITYQTVQESHMLYFVGFFLFKLLMLGGLYILLTLYERKMSYSERIILLYLVIVSAVFSQQIFYLFHLTALLFLVLITTRFYANYKKQKSNAALLLTISFGILCLSQFIFIFTFLTLFCYVIAEMIQLAGYLLLFVTLFLVLRHGKKAK